MISVKGGMSPTLNVPDHEQKATLYKLLGRRIYLLIEYGFCAILFLLLLFWQQKQQLNDMNYQLTTIGSGQNTPLVTTISNENQLTNPDITLNTLTSLQRVFNTNSVLTSSNFVDYLDGLYVRPSDSPEAGDITGSYDIGFNVQANSVALGTDTTGDYVQSIIGGAGLLASSGGEGVVVTMSIGAGDGITVSDDDISVRLQTGGGLAFSNGDLGLQTSCDDQQVLKWDNGSGNWVCATDDAGAGSLNVRETDGSPNISPVSVLELGPVLSSEDEFIVSHEGGGITRLRLGDAVALLNVDELVSGSWTFSSSILANGGLSCSNCIALGSETSGDYVAGLSAGSGLSVTGSGGEGSIPTVSIDSSLAIFKTVDVNVGTDPVADSLTDSLALSGGNGIVVSGDATIDTITLSANLASAGGLTISSGGISLLTSCNDGEILKWDDGLAHWSCASDNADLQVLTVRLTDASTNVSPVYNLELGPVLNSDQEFILSDEGSNIARLRLGTVVAMTNVDELISGTWTFSSSIAANGGLACTSCIALSSETSGDYVAGLSVGSGLSVTGSGGEGSTPTISLDSSLAIFKTIDASAGTDPVADSLTDSLVISGSSGIIATGDASSDTLSLTASLTTNGGLTIASGGISLLNTCGNSQFLQWTTGTSVWGCASLPTTPNIFQSVAGDGGTAAADSSSDTITIAGGNGLASTATDTPDNITLNIDLASGSGMTFSGGALTLLACSDGQILKHVAGSWACANESNLPATAYQQQLAGTDNVTLGSSFTPLLTNGSGTAQNLAITIASGSKVTLIATIELSSSLATGPANFMFVRDDNNDNDCVTGGGDGTQVGGQITSFVATVAQSFTTTFSFADSSPGSTTVRYQLCGSTSIGLGTATVTDRSLRLEEASF